MAENLTVLEAYTAMYTFLRNYYYRGGKPEEIGILLSSMTLWKNCDSVELSNWLREDGKPLDPAMWQDWLEAIKSVTGEQK